MSKLVVAQSFPISLESKLTPYTLVCSLFTARLVRDRFNNFNKYSDFSWDTKKDPEINPCNLSISDLMDKRAQEFIKKSVTVQWSGGVDSTALLLALIKNGIAKDDLVIFYDVNSVEEFPKLYYWLRDNKYNLVHVTAWRKALGSTQTDLITNGWCADQLFGSMFFHKNPQAYSFSLDRLFTNMELPLGKVTKGLKEETIDAITQAGRNTFNLNITTAAQLGWFINFTMKWTWVSTFNELYLLSTPNLHKSKVFYNTPEFQAWSLNNYEQITNHNIYGSDASNYKKPLKEYIYSIFPDKDYLINKTKKPSWNAASSVAKRDTPRITVKTTDSYEIFEVPNILPEGAPQFYSDPFFTKFKK